MKFSKPTFIIDKSKCLENIEQIAKKANKSGVSLRPHFKTHQSLEVGKWFRNFGVKKIAVSSVDMAHCFMEDGWDDITIAFPFNRLQLDEMLLLSEKINLNIVVSDANCLNFLKETVSGHLNIYIEIDTGYHRSGISSDDISETQEIINSISKNPNLVFKGFLNHSGNTYYAKSREEIQSIAENSISKLAKLKAQFGNKNQIEVSFGDTPSCSVCDDFRRLDEIRPGNFVFYDLFQWKLGSCDFRNISVAVACPIVAKYPSRSEVVIYGGAVHFSKEFLTDKKNACYFGVCVELTETGWTEPLAEVKLKAISQEHGTLKVPGKLLDKFQIGDVVGVIPVHSCLTANLLKSNIAIVNSNDFGENVEVKI